jgi:hypothetical protein
MNEMKEMARLIDGFHLPPLARLESGKQVQNTEEWRKRREEILSLLQREMYGTTPPPCTTEGTVLREDRAAYSSKAVERGIEIGLDAPGGRAAFPLTLVVPQKQPLKGVFLNLAFMIRGEDGLRYCPSCPIEEIIDEGFAIAIWDYLDVASDDGDFSRGLAGVFPRDAETGWGKIGVWAYSMSRVADYLKLLPEFENVPFAAIGFSRLGKTALWAGAQDERFNFVMPIGSGTGGLGFTRRNRKESITALQKNNGHWFCKNFRRYINDAEALPFDQHFVIAACAPRPVLSAAGLEDQWADGENEYLACIAASEGYRLAGGSGFIGLDRIPRSPAVFAEGDIALSFRYGTHFLSRADWRFAMDYMAARRR